MTVLKMAVPVTMVEVDTVSTKHWIVSNCNDCKESFVKKDIRLKLIIHKITQKKKKQKEPT